MGHFRLGHRAGHSQPIRLGLMVTFFDLIPVVVDKSSGVIVSLVAPTCKRNDRLFRPRFPRASKQ